MLGTELRVDPCKSCALSAVLCSRPMIWLSAAHRHPAIRLTGLRSAQILKLSHTQLCIVSRVKIPVFTQHTRVFLLPDYEYPPNHHICFFSPGIHRAVPTSQHSPRLPRGVPLMPVGLTVGSQRGTSESDPLPTKLPDLSFPFVRRSFLPPRGAQDLSVIH